MGKPSSTRLSQDSKHSIASSKNKMNNIISTQKIGIKKKKYSKKTLTNVLKVFHQIKDENTDENNSLSDISSINNTVIDLDTIITPERNKINKQNSLIVICDDEEGGTSERTDLNTTIRSPIHCSTPIYKPEIPLNHSYSNNNNVATKNLNKDIINLAAEINNDSYLTIDLTGDSSQHSCSGVNNTVIDLVNTTDKTELSSISSTSLAMSGDSDVTVIKMKKDKPNKQMKKFVKGISKMASKDKEKLLKLITRTIFNGCNISPSIHSVDVKQKSTRATETAEDTYIKEVILGQTNSRNSIGSNIYNPERDIKNKTGLRMVVIDGSNVAMQHTMGRVFSVKGLKICIDYFIRRGHVVKAFVPRFRCKYGKSTEPRLLDTLERQGLVVYTPSREIQGKMISSYDDRYIVQCAAEFDGVIVSGDNYRDLMSENSRWRSVIENRLLQFTWVGDMIMFPKDPLGRNGPTLETFLRHL